MTPEELLNYPTDIEFMANTPYNDDTLARAIFDMDMDEIDRLVRTGHRINHPLAIGAVMDTVRREPEQSLDWVIWLQTRGLDTRQLTYRIYCSIHSQLDPTVAQQLIETYQHLIINTL